MRPKKPRTEEPEAEEGPRARDILAANLKTLLAAAKISARPNELTRLKHITEKSNGVLSNGKLDRIRRAERATDIDSVGELAKVYKLEPWQLLVPNLNPEHLPVIGESELLQQVRSLVLSTASDQVAPNIATGSRAIPNTEADTASGAERRALALKSLRKGEQALDGDADALGKPRRVPRKGAGKRA